MSPLAASLRDAGRIFRRSPGIAITAVLTLAIGIAAPTAMFSLATGILGELPFEEPHELVEVEQHHLPSGRTNMGATRRDLEDWRRVQRSFEGLAAVDRRVFQLGGPGPRPARIRGAAVSPRAFGLLGEPPLRGRGLTAADAAPGAPPVVLLAHEIWEDRYDRDPGVIGTAVRVDGVPRTVVGIMAAGFEFPRTELLWIPLPEAPGADTLRSAVFGRLADGVSLEAAQRELDVIARNRAAALPGTHRDVTISVHPFAHAELGDGEAALMLYAMTLVLSFVLVVACVNVAHLLLARAIDRSREIAMRMALGASRGRVLGSVLAESLLLAAVGGAAGVGLTYGAVGWLDARLDPVINLFWASIEVDATVLAFVGILVVVSSLMAGLLPARRASSIELLDAIKEGGRTSRGARAGRTARTLVALQVAFSCGLLILSGLLVKGVVGLATRELAFDPEGVLTAAVELREFEYPGPPDRLAFADDLERELTGAPGIESVALASGLPGLGAPLRTIALEGSAGGLSREAGFLAVTPEFFTTFRSETVAGRLFTEAEGGPTGPRLAVVNDVFVERFLPEGRAVGRRFRLEDADMTPATWIEIVGVVPDGGVFAEGTTRRPGVFVPLAQEAPAALTIALRAADPAAAARPLREAVGGIDSELPIFDISTLREALRDTSVVQRTFGSMFGAFGVLALLLAVVGLYAVVSYGVKRRTREVGMRRALGASEWRLTRLLLRSALIPLAGGLAVGTSLALLIAPAFGAALFGVSPRDPAVYLLIVALLGASTIAAALLPALRAARMQPMRALRTE